MFTPLHRPIGKHVAFDFLADPDQKTPRHHFAQKLLCFLRSQDTCWKPKYRAEEKIAFAEVGMEHFSQEVFFTILKLIHSASIPACFLAH